MQDMKSYYVIYALLDSSEENPVTSSSLAEEMHMSNKTVQNILTQVQEYCMDNGIRITAKSGSGFYAEILDRKKAGSLRQQLDIYFSKNFLKDDKNALFISAICLYILNRETPVTIEQLCELFYLSKSSIYTYISKVKEVLSRAKITVIRDSKRRLVVEASEYVKRLFVAFSVGSNTFQYDLKKLFGSEWNLFDKLSGYKEKLNRLLKEYGISFEDEEYYIFMVLISYSEFRYQRYQRIEENELRKKRLETQKELPVWDFVKKLTRTLHLSIRQEELELFVLAGFVTTFNTNVETVSIDMIGREAYGKYAGLYSYMDNCMKEIAGELREIPLYEEELKKLAYRISMLKYFDYYDRRLSYMLIQVQTPNALTKYMARLLTEKIGEYYGMDMSHRSSTSVCLFFQELLLMGSVQRQDIEILFVAKNGKMFANGIRQWMKENLNPTPEKIDICSLYEVEEHNPEKYDMILTDYKSINIPELKNQIYRFDSTGSNRIIGSYQDICYDRKMDLERLIERFDYIFIYHDMNIKHTDEFLTRLDNDLDGVGNIPVRKLRKLGWPINYIGKHSWLLVPYLYKEKEKHENILSIYFNTSSYEKYSILIFISLYTDYSKAELAKLYNLFEIMNQDKNFICRLEKRVLDKATVQPCDFG